MGKNYKGLHMPSKIARSIFTAFQNTLITFGRGTFGIEGMNRLLLMLPNERVHLLRPHYDDVQQAFDEAVATGLDYTEHDFPAKMAMVFESAVLATLTELPSDPLSVMEVGCGNGRWLARLHERLGGRMRAIGIDLSPKLIEIARATLGNWATVLCGNFFEYHPTAQKDNLFDAIYLFDVLQHFDQGDYQPVLEKARTLLKPNGLLIIMDKERFSSYGLKMALRRWLGWVPAYYSTASYPAFGSLARLAQKGGFQVRRRGKYEEYRYLILGKAPALTPIDVKAKGENQKTKGENQKTKK